MIIISRGGGTLIHSCVVILKQAINIIMMLASGSRWVVVEWSGRRASVNVRESVLFVMSIHSFQINFSFNSLLLLARYILITRWLTNFECRLLQRSLFWYCFHTIWLSPFGVSLHLTSNALDFTHSSCLFHTPVTSRFVFTKFEQPDPSKLTWLRLRWPRPISLLVLYFIRVLLDPELLSPSLSYIVASWNLTWPSTLGPWPWGPQTPITNINLYFLGPSCTH